MLISQSPPLHLTYCLNIHPGETWSENFNAIKTHALKVRNLIAPDRQFGLGLRLSRRATDHLRQAGPCADFRRFLEANNLYVFTINGFPYGPFHGTAVKTAVYLPDWRTAERLEYTVALADILAELVPEGVDGSISTVPGAYKEQVCAEADVRVMVENLAACAAHLHNLRARTGREIHIGLEPEPDCCLETTPEVIAFFEGPLAQWGVPHLASRLGCGRSEAERVLRRHVGVCFDTCHLAIQFEQPAASLRALEAHGVRVSKMQISAALRVVPPPAALLRLREFVDPVYLHQVKVRRGSEAPVSFPDLPAALAAAAGGPPAEWRIHFHVPLYFQGDAELQSTATVLDEAFFREVQRGRISHLEIETYTFHVLPQSLRTPDVTQSIAREFAWVVPRLTRAP